MLLGGCLKDTIKELTEIKGVELNPKFSIQLIDKNIGLKDL
jgi:hypothetical protein